MGRPLNKKYFGNRNIGSTGTGDDYGIGGEGLAAYTLAAQKGVVAINNTYQEFPALTIPAPDLPSGVQATATVVWEVNTVSLAGGTGYTAGTIVQIIGLDNYASSANRVRFTITVDGGGVPTFNAFTNRGAYTDINGAGITTWAVIGPDGDDAAQATITFRLKSITTDEKGSGYTSAPTLSWARDSSQTAGGQTQTGTPTVALTTDSGSAGSSTNQENAIKIYAVVQGGNRSLGDVVKQINDRAYKVKTDDGTQQKCVLKTSGNASAVGEADITAYDSDNGEYYVYKLTSRKAVVVPKSVGGGTQFASGTSVPWTLGNAEEDYSVKIDNA